MERRAWADKFRDAFRGVKEGVRGQSSFFTHFFAAAAVVTAGLVMGIDRGEWCLVLLSIAGVLAAEMFNTALEAMARAFGDRPDPNVGRALDIGSASVLLAALGAAAVGLLIFVPRFGQLVGWW
jgi:diacylglycerol kinase